MGKGKPEGSLAAVPAIELLSQVLCGLLARHDLDPALVEDVLIGCAGQPTELPAGMVGRCCGSSQRAVHFAAQGVMCGEYDMVVVGGIESARPGCDPDPMRQGVAAEVIATKWKLTRDQLDEYAAQSHQRAGEVAAAGEFLDEIIPIDYCSDETCLVLKADETINPDATPGGLAQYEPTYAATALADRFPEIAWQITEGNTAQRTDGASALLIASESRAAELGLRPRARFHSFALASDDPLIATIPATHKVLARAGLKARDIDHFEVNESFAAVPLAWQAELSVNPDLLNPRGGAIALGHPMGASGTRLMTTMLRALEDTGGRYGLQTMSEPGGLANATIIERLW